MGTFWSAALGGIIVSIVNAVLNFLKDERKDNISRQNLIRLELSRFCGYCATIKNSSSDNKEAKFEAKNQCEASLAMLKLNLVEEGISFQDNISKIVQDLMLKADEYSNHKDQDNAGEYLSAYYRIENELISSVGELFKPISFFKSIEKRLKATFKR